MKSTQNTTSIYDISIQKAAKYAGIGYLMSFAGAIFASYGTNSENIVTNEVLFRAGIFGYLIAILGDIIRVWALFIIFKIVNKNLALLAVWFMLIHDAIFGAVILNLIFSSTIASASDFQTVFEAGQINSLNTFFLEGFNYGFQIGLLIFSFHLATLGLLAQKSGIIPRIYSILLYLAALGFFINSSVKILIPQYPEIIWSILSVPCFIGELAIILWIVIKGGNRFQEIIN